MGQGKLKRRGNRGRVLQRSEQRSTGLAVVRPEGGGSAPVVRPQLVVEFLRALIRNNPSEDLMVLSLHHAAHVTGATKRECELMMQAIRGEQSQSVWPEGFFSG